MNFDAIPTDFCSAHCCAWSKAGRCNVQAYSDEEECTFPGIVEKVRWWEMERKKGRRK